MLRQLIEVIGVGETREMGNVTLTLLSVERYREGLVVLFRLLRRERVMKGELPWPELSLHVVDDADAYRVWPMGGGGGGGIGELDYRISYTIAPAPAMKGRTDLEVTEIVWQRHTQGQRESVSTDAGPWRFTVAR